MSNDLSPYVSFLANTLKNGLHSRTELDSLVAYHAPDLQMDLSIDRKAFLMALMGCETSFGRDNVPRFELQYSRSGLFYKRSSLLQQGYESWGDLCAMSYGPMQILWINAAQLGLPLSYNPVELTSGVVSIPYVVEFLNSFVKQGAKTKEDFFASWNAGPGCLKNKTLWPTKYVQKAVGFYTDLMKNN